jgi:predicted ATPase
MHHAMRCEYPVCLKALEEIDALARSSEDSSTYVIARMLEALTHYWQGDFVRAQQATDCLIQVYDVEKHGHLVHTLGHDPKSLVLSWAGRWLYALGYPDRARQAALDQLELSRRLGHAFDLCWALTGGAEGLLLRGDTSLGRQWASEARAIAREHALKIMELQMVAEIEGEASIIDGDHANGYRNENQTAVLWRGQGGVVNVPFINTYLARALTGLKRFDEAKALLDETLEIIDRTGHRSDEADAHRVLGELLWQQPVPDWDAAESFFLRALEVARSQQAKGFELRAAMSLARLWRSRGKRKQALDLLAPIYGWFTEGFDARDLREAKALLDELS